MQLTPKQNEYWRNCTHRWNFKTGAISSGKTYMDYFLLAKRILEFKDKFGLIVLLGNTKTSLERNIIRPMQKIWGKRLIKSINSNNVCEMFGVKVDALGADKVSQADKIRGSRIAYCYGDEVATWSQEVFEMLKGRLSLKHSTFDGTCNPEGPNHWLKKFLDSEADIYNQHYQLYDNVTLGKEEIEALENDYRGTIYFDRLILGKWVLAEGLVYRGYNTEIDPLAEVPENLTGRRIVGCDYGTSNACVYLMAEEGYSGTWYITREYYYSGKDELYQKTDEDYCDDYEVFVAGQEVSKNIVDPSALSFITALKRRGHVVIQAENNVKDGIRNVNTMLNNGKLKILKRCSHLLNEMASYRWNPKKTEDEPIKEDDHAVDAMRYVVNELTLRESSEVPEPMPELFKENLWF